MDHQWLTVIGLLDSGFSFSILFQDYFIKLDLADDTFIEQNLSQAYVLLPWTTKRVCVTAAPVSETEPQETQPC